MYSLSTTYRMAHQNTLLIEMFKIKILQVYLLTQYLTHLKIQKYNNSDYKNKFDEISKN